MTFESQFVDTDPIFSAFNRFILQGLVKITGLLAISIYFIHVQAFSHGGQCHRTSASP